MNVGSLSNANFTAPQAHWAVYFLGIVFSIRSDEEGEKSRNGRNDAPAAIFHRRPRRASGPQRSNLVDRMIDEVVRSTPATWPILSSTSSISATVAVAAMAIMS